MLNSNQLQGTENSLIKRVTFFVVSFVLYYYSLSFKYFGLFQNIYDYLDPAKNNLFLKHLLLYGHISSAITCSIFILLGIRFKILNVPLLIKGSNVSAIEGIKSGLLMALPVIAYWYVRGYEFQFSNSISDITGNIFSNFYEEIGYRMLLVGSSIALFRNKYIAIILPSLMMAYVHDQYPLEIQGIVFYASIVLCFYYIKTKSIITPWVSHQVGDMILDTALKV